MFKHLYIYTYTSTQNDYTLYTYTFNNTLARPYKTVFEAVAQKTFSLLFIHQKILSNNIEKRLPCYKSVLNVSLRLKIPRSLPLHPNPAVN